MTEKGKRLTDILKVAGFSLYFVILFVERLLALIFSVTRGDEYALTSGNYFNYLAYAVTAASLAAGTALFIRLFIGCGKSLREKKIPDLSERSEDWSFASAILLFGGMMHTGLTLAGVQFASYGFLIAAMIVKCVEECLSGKDKFLTVVSTVYLILFSMSIPVCYMANVYTARSTAFFVTEFVAVFALVPIFGVLLEKLMRTGKTSFSPVYPIVMTLLSGAVVALGWTEKVNWFVLIFASLTLLCYLTFGIFAIRREKRTNEA